MLRLLTVMPVVLVLAWGDDQAPLDNRLVDVNVVALNNQGEPVDDLTSADFEVTDAGKPQQIAFFRHYGNTLRKFTSLGPNEFSNRGPGNVPHATLILFDLMNESLGTRENARSQLVRYLQSLENADYLYLYLLPVNGRLFAVHGLPGLEGEIHRPDQAPWTRQIKPLLDQAMKAVLQLRPLDIDVAVRVQLTYAALSAIAAQLSRIPGRKNIVWITDGVPISLGPIRSDTGDFVDFTPQIRQMSEALDRTGVAIYPVQQILLGSRDTSGGTGIGSAATLESFADLTGGRRDQGKDIGPAIKQATTDVRTSYQIGYYLPAQQWDNKFHKLRITCKRKGIRIQAQTGYYAAAGPGPEEELKVIASAGATAFDAAEIGLVATLSPDPSVDHAAHLEVRIDGRDIAWSPAGNDFAANLEVSVIGYMASGQIEASRLIPLDLHDSPEAHDKAVQQGIPFAQDFKLGEGLQTLRFVAVNRRSNALGTVTIPVNSARFNSSAAH